MQSIPISTRIQWRTWLKNNYNKETKVEIIMYKKHTGKLSISHREAMEEAICFGWIDTTIKRIDEDRYSRQFAKRTEKSRWSNNTLSYAKDLIKRKLMSPHGLKMYKLGLLKPPHDHDLQNNLTAPKKLLTALQKDNALDMFESLSPSYKKMVLTWLHTAKREETKEKRIRRIVETTLNNKRIY